MECRTDFGVHKLSEAAINFIADVDLSCKNLQEETPSNFISSFMNDAESIKMCKNKSIENANLEFDVLNDYFKRIIGISAGIAEDKNSYLVNNIEEDNMDSVASKQNENDDEFEQIIASWNSQRTVTDRLKYIKDISTNDRNLNFLTSRFIDPWLLSEKSWLEDIQVFTCVFPFVLQDTINIIFLKLFREKSSAIIEGRYSITDLLASLSNTQKNKLICVFLNEIGNEMQSRDLIILYKLIDITALTNDTLVVLLEQLTNNGHTKEDRFFGSLLLLIAQQFTNDTPLNVINLLSSLATEFRGVLSYCIKSILNKVTVRDQNT